MMNNSNKQTHGSTFNLTHLSNSEFHSFLIWFNCYLTLQTLPSSTFRIERVTGRKARGLQMEEIGCKCLLKFCVAMRTPGFTWTFLKPWANQCVFMMEMFFLSYVNATMDLLWNLPFFKMVPCKWLFFPFLKPVFISIVLWLGDDTPRAILSQKCKLWDRGLVKLCQPWGVSLIWLITF